MLSHNKNINNLIVNWLIISLLLVFSIIIIGGLTRLTNSGLSIIEWELFKGIFPPMNDVTWGIYFEKYKTDGLEHNMYVGQSIVKHLTYHDTVLYNLRLWQLQVTCEMEAMYYQQQKDFPLPLEVASLILAYDIPITIQYRIDEKHFDVDGAYNVRYEMIKKRIDKAHIKGTNERLTQPHKLCVVFSSTAIEREYLAYFEFLKSKNYIGEHIEILELEELQGASGIKALRAELNPNLQKVSDVFTVKDLQSV